MLGLNALGMIFGGVAVLGVLGSVVGGWKAFEHTATINSLEKSVDRTEAELSAARGDLSVCRVSVSGLQEALEDQGQAIQALADQREAAQERAATALQAALAASKDARTLEARLAALKPAGTACERAESFLRPLAGGSGR